VRFGLPTRGSSESVTSAAVVFPWNGSQDPIVIGHLTDLHINALCPESSHTLERALSCYVNFSISTLLITGDLVDFVNREIQLVTLFAFIVSTC
jgi:predicted MPP superfamily phosphohydrolase